MWIGVYHTIYTHLYISFMSPLDDSHHSHHVRDTEVGLM